MKPNSYYKHDGYGSPEKFDPPLWKQRRNFIEDILRRFEVESVLDYGCGEAAVLSFLITPNERRITHLAGIDIDNEALQSAIENCQPWEDDYKNLRLLSLTVDIYKGSIDIPDDRFKGFEAIICTEVIEHVSPDVLNNFFKLTLDIYKPKILIVTTPNAEYNVYFPELHYGTAGAIFRHDDHKFEWTRQEFRDWCDMGAKKYGYEVEYHGIGLLQGKENELQNGHCTQACVFINLNHDKSNSIVVEHGQPHRLLKHFDFPYYNEPQLSRDKVKEEVEHYIEVLCRAELQLRKEREKLRKSGPSLTAGKNELDMISFDEPINWVTFNIANYIPNAFDTTAPTQSKKSEDALEHTSRPIIIPISDLWDILRIKQICQTKACLTQLLTEELHSTTGFKVEKDNLVIYKAFD
ncbi:hypothetical protein BDF20DRAFT_483843 [Mycotypha africana]|uniref:uncharacterized protein n=1 Tax=Mycotypha africana TaxID=64632 RepID=UPI0023008DA3|nr:uncharacterized protein BDF20DRAFT_483843 [Mycotypha africana]KAI8979170.1 hypothetical protein BDF20DRAFT_483843 [Mycotypha africana]